MAEMRRLENKVAIITGGGTGIGAGIARRFVAEGARVCIAGRRESMLRDVAASLPSGSVAICAGDVSNDADVKRIIDTALDFQGELHILVNNAAFPSHGPVGDLTPDEWRRALEVNLTGPFLTMHRAIPLMIEGGGGSIINIASVGGIMCIPAAPGYCTTKAGLIMLTKQTALDYGRKGIRCNVVCPGLVRTEMTDTGMGYVAESLGVGREDAFRLAIVDQPLGKVAIPDEIAPLCAYLASSESAFMTGSVLVIDGGISILDAGHVSHGKV
jgi:meso-butanediol dehydrogenase / (S,S)-butanediol dehydrogenase / diacetyl reductase